MNTTRRLYRNTREGKIGGVAAGLGDYLAIDPVIVRLAFVLLVLAGGFGLLAYLVGWIVIPAGDPDAPPASVTARRWDGRRVRGARVSGRSSSSAPGWR
jgi:phage shock protein PspC (stress-responsive transcriptional regulator)